MLWTSHKYAVCQLHPIGSEVPIFTGGAATIRMAFLIFRNRFMSTGIQLPGMRELARAAALREVRLVGASAGFAIVARVGLGERTLMTQRGEVRMFRTADAALALVKDELGLGQATVDLATWAA